MTAPPLLLDRYRVLRRLGPGEDGVPLLVADQRDDNAKRVLRPLSRAAFAGARLFAGVRHPSLAAVFGVEGDARDGWYLVCEFVDGVDLASARPELSRRHALGVLRDALAGLARLHHAALVHADLKPHNVVVTRGGRGRLIDPWIPGDPRARRGTLHYLAPERLLNAQPTPEADLFAAGVMLYELAYGRVPFRGESALEIVRAILRGPPDEAEPDDPLAGETARIARALLHPEPSLRPRDAGLMCAQLDRILGAAAPEVAAPDPRAALDAAPEQFGEREVLALERFLARVEEGGRTARLMVTGRAGSGRTALLRRARDAALARGWLCIALAPADPEAVLRQDLARLLDQPADDVIVLLAAAARAAPVLLLLDGLSASVAAQRDLVRRLLAPGVHGRIGLLAAGDAEDAFLAFPCDALDTDDVLELAPLGDAEVRALLRQALPELDAPEVLAAEVVRRTGGHPAAVRATLARLAEAGGLEWSGGTLVADPMRLRALPDPATKAAAEDALSGLDATGRTLLAILAHAQVPLSLADLVELCPVSAPAAAEALRALEQRRLAAREPGQVPRYLLVFPEEARALRAAAPLDAPAARSLARRLLLPRARSEGVPAGGVPAEERVLAAAGEVLAQAGLQAGGRLLLRAARRVFTKGSGAEALDLVERATALRPRLSGAAEVRALRARAMAMAGAGGADEALSDAAQACSGEASRRLILDRAHLLERLGRPQDALSVLDAALVRSDLGDVRALHATRAWSLHALGRDGDALRVLKGLAGRCSGELPDELELAAVEAALWDRVGERRRGRAAAVRARRLARRLGRLSRAAHFDSTLALRDAEAGHERRGLRRLLRAVDLLERAEDRRLLPDALARYGFVRLRRGEAKAALQAFRRAAVLFARARNRRGLGWARNGEGSALLLLGDPEAAAGCFEQGVEDRLAGGSRSGAALAAVNLYRARSLLLDGDAARAARRRALQLSEGAGGEEARLELFLAMARTAADQGRRARLAGLARRALHLAQQGGFADGVEPARVLLGQARLAQGAAAAALHEARVARRGARALASLPQLAQADALRAAALLLLGRAAAANRAYLRAVRLAADPESALAVRLLYARAALLAVRRGDATEARAGAAAAREAQHHAEARRDRLRAAAARELASSLAGVARRTHVPADAMRRTEALRQVLEASRWINEATRVEEVLVRIIDAALRLSGAARGFLVVLEEPDRRLAFAAARSRRGEDLSDPDAQISRGLVEEVVRSGRTVITSEARADERFREFRSIADLELLSVMCAPLKARQRVIGALYLDDQARVDRFDDDGRELIEALADHAAIALDKARMRAEIEQLNARLARDVARRTRDLEQTRVALEQAHRDLAERFTARNIVSRDPRMLEIFALVERVADSDAPVLIEGEPGTGKELIAKALHYSSHRRRRRFVPMNCASIPENLVEAELFGHRRGAFTGAVHDRDGFLVQADGGTLFLDEIGEMPLAMQAKLLRVLQDGEFTPLGTDQRRVVRVRIVSATNRSLTERIAAGAFREDLYWRLKVLRVEVPPLRARKGDVPLLLRHFAARIAEGSGRAPPSFTAEAVKVLSQARWKGNVRELEAMLRALFLTVDHDPIDAADLPQELRQAVDDAEPLPTGRSLKEAMGAYERRLLEAALARANGNHTRAAELLHVTRRWIDKLIAKHRL